MRTDSSTRIAFMVICIALAVSALGFRALVWKLNVYVQKDPVQLRETLRTIPEKLNRWSKIGNDVEMNAETREALGTDVFLDRLYAIDGDVSQGAIHVHMAYYTGMIDTVPHVPERCFVAGGWSVASPTQEIELKIPTSRWRMDSKINVATGEHYPYVEMEDPVTRRVSTTYMPIGDFLFRTTEFQNSKQPGVRLMAGYLFIANGRITSSANGVKALAFSLTDRYAYYCKVQFSMLLPETTSARWLRFNEMSSDLLDALLPHLMQRLPSWPEWEAAAAETRSAK